MFEKLTKEGDWLRSPTEIRAALKIIAQQQISYAAALFTSTYFREKVGNVDLMPKGCNDKSVEELLSLILGRAKEERDRVAKDLDDVKISCHIKSVMARIEKSLAEDTEEWKSLIPGRVVLKAFCARTPLQYDSFRTAYIHASESAPANPFQEIISIFEEFDKRPPIPK